jgi:hypothetical protein
MLPKIKPIINAYVATDCGEAKWKLNWHWLHTSCDKAKTIENQKSYFTFVNVMKESSQTILSDLGI